MKKLLVCLLLLAALCAAAPASGETRALLIACSDFVTQPALGSAIYAAAAAGVYPDAAEGARRMGAKISRTYHPDPEAAAVYAQLYREYKTLHDYLGRGANPVMKTLKALKKGGQHHA